MVYVVNNQIVCLGYLNFTMHLRLWGFQEPEIEQVLSSLSMQTSAVLQWGA